MSFEVNDYVIINTDLFFDGGTILEFDSKEAQGNKNRGIMTQTNTPYQELLKLISELEQVKLEINAINLEKDKIFKEKMKKMKGSILGEYDLHEDYEIHDSILNKLQPKALLLRSQIMEKIIEIAREPQNIRDIFDPKNHLKRFLK